MHDGHHRIHPIHHQEAQPYQVTRLHDQQQQQRHNPEGAAHAAHVPRKTLRPLPKIEEEKHARRNHRVPDQVRMHKITVRQVHVLQRPQYRKAIQPRDPVDAIHKVVGIHNTDKHNITNHDGPPGIHPEDPRQVKRTTHRQQMKQQPHPLSQILHVIPEAHPRDQCDAREEPQPLRREMKQQE